MPIRPATEADLPAITAIFNEVIATSTAIYADDPFSLEDRAAWFAQRRAAGYPVLVADDGDGVAGLASFGDFRAWPGFRHTVEHSVHVRADARGRGLGSALVSALRASMNSTWAMEPASRLRAAIRKPSAAACWRASAVSSDACDVRRRSAA